MIQHMDRPATTRHDGAPGRSPPPHTNTRPHPHHGTGGYMTKYECAEPFMLPVKNILIYRDGYT
ncbi:hypothetical protein BGC30_10835 [Novacetimonas hansenii]|nr:hypothetical protein BGC30_10835 [Novacetimonas hansenii]